jgi:hypothetical protein
MDIVWLIAAALFWAALWGLVEGFARLAPKPGGRP